MTDEEVASVRAEVDRIAEPLAWFALVYLLANPDPGKHWGGNGHDGWWR